MSEKPLSIQSRYGELFLIEHAPQGRSNGVWVIAVNSGFQCRTGPRRLYVHIARDLAKQGYGVVRVDLPGMGDSAGPVPPSNFDLIDPANVRNVIRHVMQNHAPRAMVLLGVCSGARASIKAAKLNPEIDGVVALSMPTFTSSPGTGKSPEESTLRMSKARAGITLSNIRDILLNKRRTNWWFWRRFLNPKFTLNKIVKIGHSIAFFVTSPSGTPNASEFVSTLADYTKQSKKMVFLFGERDIVVTQEFEDLRASGELGRAIQSDSIIVIPDGTHVFSTYSSHKQVVSEIARWLNSNFPANAAADATGV